MQWMQPDGLGVIHFLLSCMLTRGPLQLKADMDDEGNRLMGMHGYGTQVSEDARASQRRS